MVAVGEWDVFEVIAGAPKAGKSTLARARLDGLAGRAFRLVHDPARSFRGGDVMRHRSIVDAATALGDPRTVGALHAIDVGDSVDVLRFAREVGRRLVGPGVEQAPPVVVYFDEATALRGMSGSYLDPEVAEAIAQRRHEHVGYIWATQRVQFLHPVFFQLATKISVFRLRQEEQIARLRREGMPPRLLEQVPRLGRFKAVTWDLTVFEDDGSDVTQGPIPVTHSESELSPASSPAPEPVTDGKPPETH